MKKRIKYLSMLTAASLTAVFTGCSSDDEGVSRGNGRGEPVSVNIVAQGGAVGTYSFSTAPTAEESTLKTATSYIFDGLDKIEREQVLLVDGTSASATGVPLTSGPKTFYIVANAPADLTSAIAALGTDYDRKSFESALVSISGATDMASSVAVSPSGNGTGYFMTIPEGGKQQTLNPGLSNTVTTKIGRAFAKTNVEFPNTVTYAAGLGGTLTEVEYLTRNIKNNSYNQSVYSNEGQQLESFWYDKWTEGPTPSIGSADFFYEGGTITEGGSFPAASHHFVPGNGTVADGTTALYAMENANKRPLHGTATFVNIGGIWKLDAGTDVYKNDNSLKGQGQGQLNASGDFYRIVEFDSNPANVATPPTEVIREIGGKYYADKPLESTVTAETTAFNGTPSGLAKPAVSGNVGVLKYEGGRMYFSVYLTKKGAAPGTPDSEVLQVERNKYYYVTVRTINRMGSNTAQITNPGKAISTTIAIDATISVADWTDAGSTNDL